MKTIKIIDLLNKIANGEAVPKKIKLGDTKYTIYTDEITKQTYYQDDECKYFFLHLKCLDDLNDEIEILEEEKKIPEKIQTIGSKWYSDYIESYIDEEDKYSCYDELLMNKINDLIDYLEIKEKGE